jgi:hypothetical protein
MTKPKTGQDNGRQEWTFTIPLRIGCGNPGSHRGWRILAECVREASVRRAAMAARKKSRQTVNAFLMLNAVTKW